MRYDTLYTDSTGTQNVDMSKSTHIVSAYHGDLTLELPLASAANGAELTFKKSDSSANIITIKEAAGGLGIDRGQVQLGSTHDYVTVLSNGAEWFIKASNRMASHPRFYDSHGTYDIDMAVDVYLVSSYSGALTCRLPPANAPQANGRTVTIKKTDPSSNNVTITEQGGNGPDNQNQILSGQYQSITCISNGAAWYVIAKTS